MSLQLLHQSHHVSTTVSTTILVRCPCHLTCILLLYLSIWLSPSSFYLISYPSSHISASTILVILHICHVSDVVVYILMHRCHFISIITRLYPPCPPFISNNLHKVYNNLPLTIPNTPPFPSPLYLWRLPLYLPYLPTPPLYPALPFLLHAATKTIEHLYLPLP